jgi:glycosyltransferase involved in cell wall biosynthesis
MISAIVITKNEEKMIEDCLKSLEFCEEIIVLDSHSSDKTADIAKKYNAKVFENDFKDFSSSRNFAAEKAKGDWLLYVDADERVSENLKNKIIEAVKTEKYSGYEIKRDNNFLGLFMKSGGWENEYLLRLMKKDKLKKWFGNLHETADVEGKIGRINEPILHFSHRDLSSMVQKTIVWSDFEADLRFSKKHPKMTIPRFIKVFFKELITRLIKKSAWKDGPVGIIEAIYQSYSLLITYLKLWEKQNSTSR